MAHGSGAYWANEFMTFRSVNVPHAATINKAICRFTAKKTTIPDHPNNRDDVDIMFFGNAVDNSSPPTTYSDAQSKVLTTNCVGYNGLIHWTDDTTYDFDVTCIVQEIVDRSGWTTGNNLSLYAEDNYSTDATGVTYTRRSYDYTEDPTKAAQLLIYWSYDDLGSGGVVVGGSALVADFLAGSGGVVCFGDALITGTAVEYGSGGVTCFGDAITTLGSDKFGSGGVVCFGDSIVTSDNPTKYPSGGVVCFGDSPNWISFNEYGSGGIVVNSALWRNRKVLTVPAHAIGEDFDKFYLPIATKIETNGNANKVKFTTLAGATLAHELRDYDSTTGKLWAFVKLPLEEAIDNQFFIYYGWNL